MKDDELVSLLKELSVAGLGPLPKELYGIVGKNADFVIIDDPLASDLAKKLYEQKAEKEEDSIKKAMKKDPLFGSW